MRKRVLAILILLCLCLTLAAGCNKQAVVENPTPEFTGEPTPTPAYSIEGFVDETKYELVEPQKSSLNRGSFLCYIELFEPLKTGAAM